MKFSQSTVLFVVVLILSSLLIIKYAWISDDAVITLRTIDNLLRGEALLRWNIAERVQSYSHPLWLMMLTPIFAITQEYYLTLVFVSVIVSLITVLFLYKWSANRLLFFLLFPLLFYSIAFVDFTTSGLENPLGYLLVTLYVYFYAGTRIDRYQNTVVLFLIASSLMLTRLDLGLLIFPSLCLYLYENRTIRHWVHAFAGLVPIILWEIFSLVYYGFLLPNTYYAKLNTGIDKSEMVQQGLYYLVDSLNKDPVTITIILVGLFLLFVSKEKRLIFLGFGVVMYLSSVILAGGDFMTGRFLSIPLVFIVALLLFSRATRKYIFEPSGKAFALFALIIGVICFYPLYRPVPRVAPVREENRSASYIGRESMERYVMEGTRLVNLNLGTYKKWPANNFLADDILNPVKEGEKVIVGGTIGHAGLAAGPDVHILDFLGLADPLIARLPAKYNPNWRIGHYRREIPAGYVETIRTGKNVIEDKQLAEYYEYIQWITRGPIFSRQRLNAMYLINTGKLDYLINEIAYRYNPSTVNIHDFQDNAISFQSAVLVSLSSEGKSVSGVSFNISPVTDYYIEFCESNKVCEKQRIPFKQTIPPGIVHIENSDSLRNRAIKRVLLYPADPSISNAYTISNFEVF